MRIIRSYITEALNVGQEFVDLAFEVSEHVTLIREPPVRVREEPRDDGFKLREVVTQHPHRGLAAQWAGTSVTALVVGHDSDPGSHQRLRRVSDVL